MRDELFFALLAVTNPRGTPDVRAVEGQIHRAGGVSGWPKLVEYAERHRVMPLFANRLRTLGWMEDTDAPVDAATRASLGEVIRAAAFAELASLAELKRICARFGAEGVAPVLLKGLALSQLCFRKIGWRTNHDIDLLIDPAELRICDRLLSAMDYARVEPDPALDEPQVERWRQSHKDWVYIHRTRRTIVELHYRLFDNVPLCAEVDLGEVAMLDLFGQHRMLTLTGDALRTYLALHGLLHSWSRLKWLIDYELVRVDAREIAPSVAVGVADRLGDLLFAPSSSAPAERGYGRRSILVRSSLAAMTGGGARELETTRFGTTIKNISHYLISARPSYWAAELRYDLSDSSRDGAAVEGLPGVAGRVGNWLRRKSGHDSEAQN